MSHVCDTAYIIRLDMTLPGVVKEQQGRYMLTKFSRTTAALGQSS